MEAARRVEAGDYTTRISLPVRAWRPVRQLGRAFNTMVERLERDEDQRRTLLNDVSHELRTPLSVISGNLVGANVQTDGFDVGRLQSDVVYRDNVRDLVTDELPVPEP